MIQDENVCSNTVVLSVIKLTNPIYFITSLKIALSIWLYLCLFASSSSARLAASRESPATRIFVTSSLPSCFNFVNLRRLCSTCFRLLLSSSLTSFLSLGSSPSSALQKKIRHSCFISLAVFHGSLFIIYMLSITEYKRTLLIEEIANSLLGLISKKNHIFVVKVLHAKHSVCWSWYFVIFVFHITKFWVISISFKWFKFVSFVELIFKKWDFSSYGEFS